MTDICSSTQVPQHTNPLSIEQEVLGLQSELHLLREMIGLLQDYERQCVDKVDLKSAKQTRCRISALSMKEEETRERMVALAQDKQVMQISEEQEDLIQCFDRVWSEHLNQLVAELAECEQKLKNEHKLKRQEILQKMEQEKNNGFKPSTRLANLKRKVYGLMKLHNYEQAEMESRTASLLEQQERKAWEQKVDERQRNALELFAKRTNKEFQVLRSKNKDILFKKMNERDNKFSILLKKQQVRRLQASKSTKELMKSISVTSLNTKRHP